MEWSQNFHWSLVMTHLESHLFLSMPGLMLLGHDRNNLSGIFWCSTHWFGKSALSNTERKYRSVNVWPLNWKHWKLCQGYWFFPSWHCLNFIKSFCPCASDKMQHLIYFCIDYLGKGRLLKPHMSSPLPMYTHVHSECACAYLSLRRVSRTLSCSTYQNYQYF